MLYTAILEYNQIREAEAIYDSGTDGIQDKRRKFSTGKRLKLVSNGNWYAKCPRSSIFRTNYLPLVAP